MKVKKSNSTILTAAILMGAGAGTSATAWAESFTLEEVVVTARRQAESLQDAGIAIDAVTGTNLENKGITNANELAKIVPALSLTNGGSNITSIYMRGVGNNTVQSFTDPSVIPNYDGVSMGRGSGVLGAAFYDLERVEVLKGPQGILYGRNSTGGNINVIPAKPVLGETSGALSLGAGNLSNREFSGHVNLGLSDTSAARFAATRHTHDGIYNDGTGDKDLLGLRAQFLVEPSDALSIRVGADYTDVGGKGSGGTLLGITSAATPVDLVNTEWMFTPTGLSEDEGLNSAASNAARVAAGGFVNQREQEANSEYWGVNAEINFETSIGTLTFVPAHRSAKDHSFFYGPAQNVGNINEEITQTSFELRLAGEVGIFDYVVGGIYFEEDVSTNNAYAQESVLPHVFYEFDNESRAVFGQLTAKVSDNLRLIGGIRYTEDDKAIDGGTQVFVAGGLVNIPLPTGPIGLDSDATLDYLIDQGIINSRATVLFPGGPLTGQDVNVEAFNQPTQFIPLANGFGNIFYVSTATQESVSFNDVTWRAAVEYDLAEESMLYASIEEGYRAGGTQLVSGYEIFQPEYITAYTLGSKNRFMDNRVQLNIEAFLWQYEDQQVQYDNIDAATGESVFGIINVGDADIKGVDIDLIARVAANTTVGAKVQYLDATYSSAVYRTAYPNNDYGCPATDTGLVVTGGSNAGNPIVNMDCSGKSLMFSPEWTFNLDVEQVFPMDNGYELVANVDAAYRDDQLGAENQTEFAQIPSYWTVDARLSLNQTEKNWSLSAYVRNIGDTRRNLFPQTNAPYAVGHWNDPRTYGLKFSMQF
ncbi:TonB-dependent receptor [Pseudomaricurvus alcaniphilus]|uniref:TonB-dependent receptor n=1 Tax=Pseudomaricurvus alcaniphilus TaxID=1166482 RepID=UPI001408D943|nr:TonB-dependent receptor [Pseudomaricurvus alcaniphilus]NHN39980.1 TonB-dependent receptor [Pseudomaricurvus alcaniphilus]